MKILVMAMILLNRPSLLIYGGSMRPSYLDEKNNKLDIVSAFEAYGKYISNEINDEERQLITESTFASSKDKYFSKINEIADISLERQSLIVGLNDSIAALQRESNNFLDNSFITSNQNICVMQQNIPDGSETIVGEQVGIGIPSSYLPSLNKKIYLNKNNKTSKIDNLNKTIAFQIPFFYLSNKDRGIKDGDKAVIYPNNVPKNKYGGIKGKVISSKNILANEEDTQFITGFTNIRPYETEFNNGNLVYYGVIELEKDPNTL